MGKPDKHHLVKDCLLSSRASIISLQETKLLDIHRSLWRSIGGRFLDSFAFVQAVGTAGGIVIAWDKIKVSGTLIHTGAFSHTLEFSNLLDKSIWLCSSDLITDP